MKKSWKVTAKLLRDSTRIEDVVVKANTERKAAIFAQSGLIKKYGTKVIDIINVVPLEGEING